jgi:glucose/arabinose dehydrogenase
LTRAAPSEHTAPPDGDGWLAVPERLATALVVPQHSPRMSFRSVRRLFTALLAGAGTAVFAQETKPAETAAAQRDQALQACKVPAGFRYEILVMGDIPEPVALQFAPDGRLWFTGRRGHIWAYDFAGGTHAQIAKLDVCWEPTPGREANERGLHGLDFDPDYLRNGHVYLHYAPWAPTNATAWSNRVSRFTVDTPRRATGLKPDSEKILLTIPSLRGFHQGGAVQVHPLDGLLYVTAGDNNVSSDTEKFWNDPANPPQVLTALQGKVLRLNRDGSIPRDNPFVNRADAHPAVYTYGHRNPYSLNVDPKTGRVVVGEVGYDRPEDWEEINLLRAGGNYGWPRCMGTNAATFGGQPCPLPDAVPPFVTYHHDLEGKNAGGNATSGPFYRRRGGTNDFPERFEGGLFYADYVRKWIRFAPVKPDGTADKTEPFARGMTGILAMQQGPDGGLYFVEYGGWFTGSPNDKLARIVPAK